LPTKMHRVTTLMTVRRRCAHFRCDDHHVVLTVRSSALVLTGALNPAHAHSSAYNVCSVLQYSFAAWRPLNGPCAYTCALCAFPDEAEVPADGTVLTTIDSRDHLNVVFIGHVGTCVVAAASCLCCDRRCVRVCVTVAALPTIGQTRASRRSQAASCS
jgi:hypothetical protein